MAQSHSQGFPGGACKSEKGWEEARDAYTHAYQSQCIRLVSPYAPLTPTGSPARKKHRSATSPSPFQNPRGTANDPIHILSTTPISFGTFPVGGVGGYPTSDPIMVLGTRLFLAPNAVPSMDRSDLPRPAALGPARGTRGGHGRVGSGSSSLGASSSHRRTSSFLTPGAGSGSPSVAATRVVRRFRNHINIKGHKINIAEPSSDNFYHHSIATVIVDTDSEDKSDSSCNGKVINVSDFDSTDSEVEHVVEMCPTTPLPAFTHPTSSLVAEQDPESDYIFDDFEETPELNNILIRADAAAALIHVASSIPAHE